MKILIPQSTIRLILETAQIEEVVGEFVQLRKRGSNFVGSCPFHDEKTPSFSVSATKGIYKCFGCGKAGNSVNFIMEHEHYTYPEALRYLAKKYNIPIQEEEPAPEDTEKAGELESLYNVHAFARDYFVKILHETEDGKALALSYLKEREFRPSVIEKFQLGFCLPAWEGFTLHAREKGYNEDILIKSGLSIKKDNRTYDRFRARVIFPIHNLTGRVIGFGGRILTSGQNLPKYVNSPETEIYNKSKVLYGLYFSRSEIASAGNCYLVEGYTDVISLYQAGIRNVVASSGTSLTQDQIRMIRRYAPTITILYDGDEAGLKASFRGIDLILEQGMNVKIVMFPDGEDPDSFVRKNRLSDVEEFLNKERKDFLEFKTAILLKESGGDPVRKATVIREIVQSIALIPDAITRSVYIKECSAKMDVAEQTLINELNKRLREKFRKLIKSEGDTYVPEFRDPLVEQQQEIDITDTEYQEKDIVRIMLLYGDRDIFFENADESGLHKEKIAVNVATFIVDDLVSDGIMIKNPVYVKIFKLFTDYLEENKKPPSFEYFRDHPDIIISKTSADITNTPYEISPHWEDWRRIRTSAEWDRMRELVVNEVLGLKSKRVLMQLENLQKELQGTENEDAQLMILEKIREMKRISIQINDQLSRVITH
ncbi:MAG: DNA primase [Bacteroidales bacterium]|nr:DNA primase [Bacteroidales bacterium]